ncbi:MAG: L-2-hydroxyglutarate oxidase [Verrucomicrobiae bacterium]|nr:L-2-hydroxyglutarate oxidase [Verrucomicrobiae bacterium]
MAEKSYDVVVVGGGIVWLASAYQIARARPGVSIAVLEKESALGAHQTGHNSGVLHSGLYYRPGSHRAKLCGAGRRELVEFAREHQIAHDICGKIVVATDESELPHLERIFQNGRANEVEGLEKIDAAGIREIEPHCAGVAGLRLSCTGIIDFVQVAGTLGRLLREKHGALVRTGARVEDFRVGDSEVEVRTGADTLRGRIVVACAGLQADRVARRSGAEPGVSIVGFRGDYYELSEQGAGKVRHLIYPVPDPRFPFLGVHFTRMIHGGVECGPNAVFSFKREGYGRADFSLRDTAEALAYPGTWKLFAKHWRYGWAETRRAWSKRLFLESLRKLIPSLEMEDLKPGRAGVRAVALDPEGAIVDDFKIVRQGPLLHVLNAPSPAATACLAIGRKVAEMI